MKKVVLFGGSFDPVHCGHLEIAKQARIQRGADSVWFVLNQNSPFKEQSTSFSHRYKMLEIMLQPYDGKLLPCDIDQSLPTPSYAYNTVVKLMELYPEVEFEWLIGSDQIEKLDQWYEFDKMNKLITFVVYGRDDSIHPYPKIKGELLEVSSTQIRHGISVQTHPKILNYMMRNGLYLDSMCQNRLSDFRYQHTLRVTELALELAEVHHVDLKKVYLAAMFHDYCKEKTDDIYFVSPDLPKAFDHAFAAASLLAKRYYVRDKKIISAIKGHVSGHSTHDIGKILFIADKCERGRNYDCSALIALSIKNLNDGFKAVKEASKLFLEKSTNE